MELHFESLIQLIFPPSEDERIIAHCTPEDFMGKLSVRNVHQYVEALAPFSDPHIRAAIHLIKFHNNKQALVLLGALTAAHLKHNCSNDAYLIPIPLSSKRQRERGYNQAELILKQALRLGAPQTMYTNLLYRTIHTPPQTSLTKKDRLHNIRGAFAVHHQHASQVSGKHIILVDDVTTTGATLAEARDTLLSLQPASVRCIALAH